MQNDGYFSQVYNVFVFKAFANGQLRCIGTFAQTDVSRIAMEWFGIEDGDCIMANLVSIPRSAFLDIGDIVSDDGEFSLHYSLLVVLS